MDDDDAKPKKQIVVGEDLSQMSVSELTDRIAALKSEIARIEADIDAKQGALSAADAVFKS